MYKEIEMNPIIALIATIMLNQQSHAQTEDRTSVLQILTKLQTKELKFRKEPLSLIDTFRFALSSVDLPGGIELVGQCGIGKMELTTSGEWSADDVLGEIIKSQPYLSREISPLGTVNLVARSARNGLLDVRLTEVVIPDRQMLGPSVNILFHSPLVLERMNSLGLTLINERLEGFQKLKQPAPIEMVIKDMTLRQALNALAALAGDASWAYVEESCHGEKKFRLSFNKR